MGGGVEFWAALGAQALGSRVKAYVFSESWA